MKKLFEQMSEITVSKGGDLIKGAIFIDRFNGKKKLGLMVESTSEKQGKKEYSDIISIDYASVFSEKLGNKLECLMNYGTDITPNDIEVIKNIIEASWGSIVEIPVRLKASFSEMCQVLLECKINIGETDKDGYRVKLVEHKCKEYIHIRTSIFEEKAREYDWVPIQLKRALKLNDMILANGGRYDYKDVHDSPRGICICISDLEREVE